MPANWRSSAAQVFAGGRIPKIDDYWRATQLSGELFFIIEEWDLWDVAFGGLAKSTKKDWKAYRGESGFIAGLATKVFGSKPRSLGSDLFGAIEQNVVQPLQTLFNTSRLTINFDAKGWFEKQAGFPEYITMWDRLKTDASLNVKPDDKNPAEVRAKADRWALYGQFGKADTQTAGMNLPHVKKVGGQTSKPTWNYSATKPAASDSQVFAALNYGRRMHGSNTTYGKSCFELDHGFKQEAIFFAMDTFTAVYAGMGMPAKTKDQRSKLYQVSANSFGGAILLAIKSQCDENLSETNLNHSKELAADLLTAARIQTAKSDNAENHLFIEAHIFQKVDMTPACIAGIRVSKAEIATVPTARANIQAFTQKTGIPINYIA